MIRRASLWLTLACGCIGAAHAGEFVTIDEETGLFRKGDERFSLLSVTYVQPAGERTGANAGAINIFDFDLTRIADDFRHMRRLGVGAIYMRIGTGFFLTQEGAWRRLDDPYHGVLDPDGARAANDTRLAAAAAQGIGPFTYNYELFDYLLDCAEDTGIYVVPMIMDNWSRPRKHDLGERLSAVTNAETWQSLISDWRQILSRYSDRTAIIGYLLEGETFTLRPWDERNWHFLAPDGPELKVHPAQLAHDDPELRTDFQQFLQARHGDIGTFKARLNHGYDRAQVTYTGPDAATPRYPFAPDAFAEAASLADVPLPTVERGRGDDGPGPGAHFPWWRNVPFDPLWVEFAYFKSWIYNDRLNELIAALREVCPNHLFFHSAAWDGAPVWHPFYIPWDHGALDCEVALHGGGYTLSHTLAQPLTFDPYEGHIELYQSVGCFRPFLRAPGVPHMFGMGEGGLAFESNDDDATPVTEADEAVWTTALLVDNFGSGAGFVNLWDWSVVTGLSHDDPTLHDHLVTESMRALSEAIEGRTFTESAARVLILANGPMLNSLMKQLAYDNLRVLSSALATAHYSFDIVTTDEIAFGAETGKVDLNGYDAVLIPELFTLPDARLSGAAPIGAAPAEGLWEMLTRWADAAPGRVLVFGATGMRDAWFNPIGTLPEAFQRLTGVDGVGPLVRRDGAATWTADEAVLQTTLNGVFTHTVQVADGGAAPWLVDGDQTLGARRILANGSRVCVMGFPLGLTWPSYIEESVSGGGLNTDLDLAALAGFYADVLTAAGVAPDYDAPPDVVAYLSGDAEVLLMRRTITSDDDGPLWVAHPRIGGRLYADATTEVSGSEGEARVIVADAGVDRAAILRAVGRIELLDEGPVSASVSTKPDGRHRIEITGGAAARLITPSGVAHTLDPPSAGAARTLTLTEAGERIAD